MLTPYHPFSVRSRFTSPFALLSVSVMFTGLLMSCSGDADPSDGQNSQQDGKTDNNGDGVADQLGVAVVTDAAEYVGKIAVDVDGDGSPDGAGLDTDGDGIIDAVDTDLDGRADSETTTSNNTTDTSTSSDTGLDVDFGDTDSTTSPEPVDPGTPEVCDGLDNDNNGIVDDLDVAGDGICDCLRIGTLGTIGPWSDGGNIFRDWLNERSSTPAIELGHNSLSAEILKELDILVVLRVDTAELSVNGVIDLAHPSFTADEITAFDGWVRAGGGVLTTLGYESDETAEMVNVNNLLSLTAPAYSPDTNLDGYIKTWLDHPIATGISNINNTNGVVADDSSGTVVAQDDGGRAALVAHEVDAGHVIVWGDEWITYDSEWASDEDQQVQLLWLNMLKWLSPAKTCQVPIPDSIIR